VPVVPSLAHECGFGAVDHAARALILTRLWVRTPCPVQIRAPRVASMRARSPASLLSVATNWEFHLATDTSLT
jgi:hypothetical protein